MKCFQKKHFVMLFFVLLFFAGCTRRSYMKTVPFNQASYSPEPGKALIIFLHPPSHSGTKRPAVFDISSEDDNKFVGFIRPKAKIAYMVQPGERLFMILSFGTKANFMKATVEEGKTYYVRIIRKVNKKTKIRKGFDFRPVREEELDSYEFSRWYEKCEYIENTEKSHQWAQKNQRSIQAKKKKYIHNWNTSYKGDKDRSTLLPQDGK